MEQTQTVICQCELIGNDKYSTTGVLAKYCDLIIKDTKIHNNSLGGIHYIANDKYSFRMMKCRILKNGKAGITLTGDGSSPILEDNIIDNNKGPGVKIGITNVA